MNNNPQTYDEEGHPVYSCCGACYINHGAGTACEYCRARDLIECELDYFLDQCGEIPCATPTPKS